MADQLYLSLWFPNFRLQSLPAALVAVLRQFALIAKDGQPNSSLGRVAAASSYPIDWTETPVYQRIYRHLDDPLKMNADRAQSSPGTQASTIENAVAEATEQLHDDTAYEFEMHWLLWLPDTPLGPNDDGIDSDDIEDPQPETTWKLTPSKVRITGFGPNFDAASYDHNGHIRVDFGLDTPWTLDTQLLEDESLDPAATNHIKQNVEKLLAFTLSVEKHCAISSRLLWTESGEPLAEKLIARLQRLN